MQIEVTRRGKKVRVKTKLQPGDILRWITKDQTAGFYRPNAHGGLESLYIRGDDKYSIVGVQLTANVVQIIADACGLDVGDCRMRDEIVEYDFVKAPKE
jgi:hypothetical protein